MAVCPAAYLGHHLRHPQRGKLNALCTFLRKPRVQVTVMGLGPNPGRSTPALVFACFVTRGSSPFGCRPWASSLPLCILGTCCLLPSQPPSPKTVASSPVPSALTLVVSGQTLHRTDRSIRNLSLSPNNLKSKEVIIQKFYG